MLSDSRSAEPRHWECTQCTFVNQNHFSKFCEVCTCRRSVPNIKESDTADGHDLGTRQDQDDCVNTVINASLGSTTTTEKIVDCETGQYGASLQPKRGSRVSACSVVCEALIPTGGTPERDTAVDRRAKLSLRKRNGPSPTFIERSRPPRASWERCMKTNLPQSDQELPQEQEELPSQLECSPTVNSREATVHNCIQEDINVSRPELPLASESGSHVPRFDLHDSCSDDSDSSDGSDGSDGVSGTHDREGGYKRNLPLSKSVSGRDSQLLQNPLKIQSQIPSVVQQQPPQPQPAPAESYGHELPTQKDNRRRQSDGLSDTSSEDSSSQDLLDPHPFLQGQKDSPPREVDWACAICTLFNSAAVDTCAACDHQRGMASESSSLKSKFSVPARSKASQDLSHNCSSDSSDCGLNDMPFGRGSVSSGYDRESNYIANHEVDNNLDEGGNGIGGSAGDHNGQSSGRHNFDSDDGEDIEIIDSEGEELDSERPEYGDEDARDGESEVVDLSNVDTLAALLSQVPATASKRKSFGLSSATFAPRKDAQVEEIIDSSDDEEDEEEDPEVQSGAFSTLPHFVSVAWLERQRGGPRVDFRSMVVDRASVARDLAELQKAAAKKAALPPSARGRGATKGKGKKAKRRKKGSKRPRPRNNDSASRVATSRAPSTAAVPGSSAQFAVAQRRPAVPPVVATAAAAQQHPKSRILPNAFANFLPVNRPPSGFAIGGASGGGTNRTTSSSSRTLVASYPSSSSSSSSSSSARSAPSRRPNYFASDTPDAPSCTGLTTTTWEGQGSITFE